MGEIFRGTLTNFVLNVGNITVRWPAPKTFVKRNFTVLFKVTQSLDQLETSHFFEIRYRAEVNVVNKESYVKPNVFFVSNWMLKNFMSILGSFNHFVVQSIIKVHHYSQLQTYIS